MKKTYERLTLTLYGEATSMLEFDVFRKRWLMAYLQSLLM